MLNRYLVTRPLQQGGFGSIYEAIDTTNQRLVAVKFNDFARAHAIEKKLLKKLGSNSQFFAGYFGHGKLDQDEFLVMELLG